MTPADEQQHRDKLTADYGNNWSVWISDGGHWYAARHIPTSPEAGEKHGCVRTVHAPDPIQLREQLVDQTERDERALADLGML
jgi:hypothetical protein